MAFTTGPDFLTGILGAQNSGNVFDGNNTNTATRYGERIGDDGFLRSGPFTADFLDSDGDGIDDRQQAGAGQPRVGSNPDGFPSVGGGSSPPPLGGGSPPLGGGEGDALGQFPGVQGQNDPLNPANNQRYSYESYAGKTFRVDSLTGEVQEADMPFGTAGILGTVMGSFRNLRSAPQNIQNAYSDSVSRGQRNVDLENRVATSPTTYGINPDMLEDDDLYSKVKSFFSKSEGLKGKGTKKTTEEATKNAYNTQKEIAEATKKAANMYGWEQLRKAEAKKQKADFNKTETEKQKAKQKERQKDRDDNKDGKGDKMGGAGGCFVEGTPIQMADGTTKEITTINVGEETKGGVVQAKMEFMPQNIYNYKDVLVSGSHWVVEDNQLVAVEDSKHGVLTDRVEPVYTFKTSNNRIWIYDIEFGDFETGSDADWEPHFEAVRQKLNQELNEKTT